LIEPFYGLASVGNANAIDLKPGWAIFRYDSHGGIDMRTATVEDGKNTGIKLAHLAAKAAEGKVIAEDLVDIGKRKAQRLVRQGYEIGEDYIDESRRYIKRNPWQSVGVALGVGLLLGFVAGALTRRS
jgi:ElaB/YqjD/DUF883 family membrane-anchored ribosome-binding protein